MTRTIGSQYCLTNVPASRVVCDCPVDGPFRGDGADAFVDIGSLQFEWIRAREFCAVCVYLTPQAAPGVHDAHDLCRDTFEW
ncbi:hypothetical protein GCM10023197_15740 [Gordonia humi]